MSKNETPSRPDRRAACPGLARMVMAADGAIARVRLALGRIDSRAARAAAGVAERHGSGAVELTIRSNMQLRGIPPGRWAEAVAALDAAGLGAGAPGADDVRNVLVSPAADIDAGRIADAGPLAAAALDMLRRNPAFHALSPKFSIQVDGGEDCAMIAHPGDIWLSAADCESYAFGFASAPDCPALGRVAAQDALALIRAVIARFLETPGAQRMRHLPEPPAQFAASLGVALLPADGFVRKPPRADTHLGLHRQSDGRRYIGAMPLAGRLSAQALRGLADLADAHSGGEIRLTPWQGVLLPHVEDEAVAEKLSALGLAVEPDRPQTRLRACAGLGCASALSDTQADARALLPLMDKVAPKAVHLTGCAKSCAALAPLPATLLARGPGRYDVFLQDGAGPSRFGRLLATDVTIESAARLLGGGDF